jgi:CBS domain-containing protein
MRRETTGKYVRDAMTENPRVMSTSTPVVDAARMMREDHVGSLPVVDEGRLVGMITDRDIAIRVVAEGAEVETTQVGSVDTPEPVTVTGEELDEALRLMARQQIRRLPVVEGSVLVGILTQADIAREEKEKTAGELVGAISEPSDTERR